MNNNSAYHHLKNPKIDNDTKDTALKYSHQPSICTGYLGYRDLPHIFNKYVNGDIALDYGCGAGFSTQLLKELKYKVVGVDISSSMLAQAKESYYDIDFILISPKKTPFQSNYFDLVLSTFVLFDIPSIDDISALFKEVKRVLKPGGVFIACTGSEYFHLHNWLTIKNDIENNKHLNAGDVYRVYLTNYDIYFHDYIYTHDDYINAVNQSNLIFKALYQPLGKKSDNIEWTTEWKVPPYSVYVCSKPE